MKKKDILVIDDEELTRDELTQIFEETKYELHLGANSIEGLEFIKRHNTDLILLDIIMPDLDGKKNERAGLEFLKRINELKPHIPVIMISVLAHADRALEALDLGAVDYIVKDTMTSKGLIEKVEKALIAVGRTPKESDLISLISKGENSQLEFKSSLRWNFRTKRHDRNIELAWLKAIVAFLNSDGGILLIGVQDDGSILGIEADNFPNEDKCLLHFSNLVRDYIGLEFSRFITNSFVLVDGKKVLKVECEKSKKPAFFKKDKRYEEFYIRSGPSNRILSMKEMLDYLENRKE